MPIWPTIRRTRCALPALVLGLVAVAGCQTEKGSRWSMPSLSPSSWFGRNDTQPEEEEFRLLPVPQDGYGTPPTPPADRTGRAFSSGPPPAPAPDAFYGVQRMGAEVPASSKASWGARMREFFGRWRGGETTQGGS